MKSILRFRISACAVFLVCIAAAITSPAQTFTTLFTFDGGKDGSLPYGALVQGVDGDLYGVTDSGGANCAPYGCGTVFKISSAGKLTTIYNFCPGFPNCTDGSLPIGALVPAADGNFYGTTEDGGSNCMPGYTCGTVFKITPTGTFTTLHTFGGSEGAFPQGALVQGTDGDLYGTTSGGGNIGSGCPYTGCGTVFKITPQGAFSLLHSFDSTTHGGSPTDGLIQARNGNFYGTAEAGGTHGGGTVFGMTPKGILTTLYNFPSTSYGADPIGGLVQTANGKFYGTTFRGGSSADGTVFEITPKGILTTLFVFCTDNNCADGAWPEAGLVQATDGNFYGTTTQGGLVFGDGTVFRITPEGTLTTLHAFDYSDGYDPIGLVQATDGNLYGITYGGGNASCYPDGCGTVFSLSVGLGPFVETIPTVGKVGSKVTILGNRMTGASSVTFNGADATFTIVSPSEIKTFVPTGATTGKVEVTLPSGTLTSKVVFRVK
jgi:uncharacterized repeat protein (TIGR03803 family)